MNIDTTPSGSAQEGRRQNATVSDDHRRIRFVRSEEGESFVGSNLHWLVNCEPAELRVLFDRRGFQFIAPTSGPIRLRPHGHDFVTIFQTTPQCRHSRFRRTHEDQTHKQSKDEGGRMKDESVLTEGE
jgi:hypothetical protein